jgi:ribosomal protein S5
LIRNSNKVGKRGQITIFIIIGIAFLAAVGLTIYVVSTTSSQRSQTTLQEQQLVAALASPVDEFVTRCLKLTAEQGLEQIGKQGGTLNPDPADSVLFNDVRVAYGIIPPTRDIPPIFYKMPPNYPWPNYPERASGVTQSIGYFGVPAIPNLESITSELEVFIGQKITDCAASWQTFVQQGLSITEGTPKATVIFAQESTSVNLGWTLQIESSQSKATVENFAAIIPVKFRSIHSAATEIAKRDSTEIDFRPADAGLGATVNKKVNGFDDVITVKDTSSLINNVPYEFNFGRKNRFPALEKIQNIPALCAGQTLYLNSSTGTITVEGEGASIVPIYLKASDPDEDSFVFNLYEVPGNKLNFVVPQHTKIVVTVSDGLAKDWQEINLTVNSC